MGSPRTLKRRRQRHARRNRPAPPLFVLMLNEAMKDAYMPLIEDALRREGILSRALKV